MRTAQFVGVFRAVRVLLHIVYALMIAVIFPCFGPVLRRRIQQRWSVELLDILNVRIDISAASPMHALHSGILVTNHISWLDVFVLSAVSPTRFVAKSEVRKWPLIGWLCARTQTLFIERGRARDAARINKQVLELLQAGDSLAVFPEGTTTDGKRLAAFHASLLQPAVDAHAQVHPVAIRYQDPQGAHSIAAAYIDDVSFGASLWNIVCCPSLHVCLVATPSFNASGSDRRTLARKAGQQISDALEIMHLAPYVVSDAVAGQTEQLPSISEMLHIASQQAQQAVAATDLTI